MISSKKILSIMATMMTYCSMAPIQMCAMKNNINNYYEQSIIDEDFEPLDYQGESFFSSMPEILQDIAERVNVYRIEKTGNYIFIYEFSVLEQSDKYLEQHAYPCLVNHNFKVLNEGLKYTFYGCLKYMLKVLIKNSHRNILFYNQKRRVYLDSFDRKHADVFLNNNSEKSKFKTIESSNEINFIESSSKTENDKVNEDVDKLINDKLKDWEGKFNEIKIDSMEEMEDLLKKYFPDYGA